MVKKDEDTLKKELAALGGSKLVYSLVTPETEAAKRKVFKGDQKAEFERALAVGGTLVDAEALVKASDRADSAYYHQFREGWTQKQEAVHTRFFDKWVEWAKPIAPVDKNDFKFHYPLGGASEGIRAMVDEYGNRARRDKFEPELHVFSGEYEGYGAHAAASYIPLVTHDRADWHKAIDAIAAAAKDKPVQIYLSQPSAIDGNVWKDYDAFMVELAKKAPKAEVILDLTYVGCITKDAKIRTDYPNIPAIVFSLSKPAGVYWDRIGGVMAREKPGQKEAYPSMYGTRWMKNISSLEVGTEFMTQHNVYDIPRKYAPLRDKAMEEMGKKLGAPGNPITFKPCDVFMLATADAVQNPNEMQAFLEREGDGGKKNMRLCLTTSMARALGMAEAQGQSVKLQRG